MGRNMVMGAIRKKNLLTQMPSSSTQEWFQTLAAGSRYKIERIVSYGHASPQGFWYEQSWDEWVLLLQGEAVLAFQDGENKIGLGPGDCLFIPAGVRHQVVSTSKNPTTIWLAVHLSEQDGFFDPPHDAPGSAD